MIVQTENDGGRACFMISNFTAIAEVFSVHRSQVQFDVLQACFEHEPNVATP